MDESPCVICILFVYFVDYISRHRSIRSTPSTLTGMLSFRSLRLLYLRIANKRDTCGCRLSNASSLRRPTLRCTRAETTCWWRCRCANGKIICFAWDSNTLPKTEWIFWVRGIQRCQLIAITISRHSKLKWPHHLILPFFSVVKIRVSSAPVKSCQVLFGSVNVDVRTRRMYPHEHNRKWATRPRDNNTQC